MKKPYFLLMFVISALFSCNSLKEMDVQKSFAEKRNTDAVQEVSIKASIEASETKTGLSGVTVNWTSGDQIKVFNSSNPTGIVFTLSEGAGTNQATFTGAAISGAGPFYAVYPASSATGLSGSAVSVILPQNQVLTAGSFGNGANLALGVSENLSDGFSFKNTLGAVCFSFNGTPSIQSVRVQTKGSEALCGTGQLTMSAGVPSLSMDAVTGTDQQIVYLNGSAQSGTFYMMLPPGALANGFMAEFKDSDNMVMVKSAKNDVKNTIVRNEFLAMPAFDFTKQIKEAFLEQTSIGYFDHIGTSGSVEAFAFNKTNCQYALNTVVGTSRYVRVQSLSLGKYFAFSTPYTLDLGASYDDVSIESVVGSTYTAPATATYKVVRKSDTAAWLVSSDLQKGIILLLED